MADPATFVASTLFRRVECTGNGGASRPGFGSSDELWADAVTRGLRTPFFRLVRSGATLPASRTSRTAGVGHRMIDDVIQPNRAFEEHAAGATMVFQGLQLSDPHLAWVANNLALDLGHAVQINEYVLPVAAKGLELHFDYPTSSSSSSTAASGGGCGSPSIAPATRCGSGHGCRCRRSTSSASPRSTAPLEAGDCLYLPRGFPHAAETVESASGHLTDRRDGPDVAAGLRQATDDAVAVDGVLRTSIPGDVTAVPDLADVSAGLNPAPCGGGWCVRCGSGSRRPACGRCARRTSTSRRRWR